MSIKVTLPAAFTRHTEGRKQFNSAADNLPGLLADIDQTFPALSTQIKGEDGKLRSFVNIYVNGRDIAPGAMPPRDGDESCSSPPSPGSR